MSQCKGHPIGTGGTLIYEPCRECASDRSALLAKALKAVERFEEHLSQIMNYEPRVIHAETIEDGEEMLAQARAVLDEAKRLGVGDG